MSLLGDGSPLAARGLVCKSWRGAALGKDFRRIARRRVNLLLALGGTCLEIAGVLADRSKESTLVYSDATLGDFSAEQSARFERGHVVA